MNTLQSTSPTIVSDLQRLKLLESVVVNANDAVLITEAEPTSLPGPRIVYVNAAFERMTGYAAAEVYGKTPRILQGPLTSAVARKKIADALAAWEPVQVELLNYRADGRTFWVEISIVPVADATGHFTHWVSVQRDITRHRDAEALLNHAEYVEAQNYRLSLEIADRHEAEERLAYAAFHDDLTGLQNRASFIERLAAAHAVSAAGSDDTFAVFFFDLDRFKVVNDTIGHTAGDDLLRHVAKLMRECFRIEDTIARIGGDEFAVLLPVRDRAHAMSSASRLLAALREPIVLGHLRFQANASIGVAMRSETASNYEELLQDADIAMYRAKQAGGDRVTMFDVTMRDEMQRSFALQADLRRGIEDDEFVLYYQPIVRVPSGALLGFEALVRWQHPQHGLLSPDHFIPLAERSGAIVPLGRRILRNACRTMQSWRETFAGAAALKMSVNVSSVQLHDASFFDATIAILQETQCPARSLQLEITETVFLEDAARMGLLLERLRALGIALAVDDFGTGYSSLSYLERFRTDVLKIDRSFVARVTENCRSVDMIRSIVDLGRVLGLEVLAEGIETEIQRDLLADAGCTSAQGFLFAKPLPEAEAMVLVARGKRAIAGAV